MIDVLTLRLAVILYFLSLLLRAFCMLSGRDSYFHAVRIVTFIALTLHVLSFCFRLWQSYELRMGYFPVVSLYESLSFFSMAVMFCYLSQRGLDKEEAVGFFITFFVSVLTFCLVFTPLFDREMRPVSPSLKSFWLPIHAAACLSGYAGFVVAFILGIVYLMISRFPFRSFSVRWEVIQGALDKSVKVGLLLFTFGLVAGAIWAYYAWGAYWRWDPKEVGSLVIWVIYVGYIHVDGLMGLTVRQKVFAVMLGFLGVVFTYFGVNYLPSVHVYHGM